MTPGHGYGSEKPVMFKIDRIVTEALDIRSFWFRGSIGAKPGQFIMAWIPSVGQRPFGISYQEKGRFAVTVRKVGPFTDRLFAMEAGDSVGIQGPYGKPFSGKGKTVALVGGGYGTAPLAFLADELLGQGKKVFLITGAVTEKYILFRERFKKKAGSRHLEMLCSTDDGSFGRKGFCTDHLTDILEKEKIDSVYCCGPEVMMIKVLEICEEKGIPAEFSLERYLKCGFGVCGSCCLDGTGWRVCKEGPVFTLEELKKVTEFGKWKRDGSGSKKDI